MSCKGKLGGGKQIVIHVNLTYALGLTKFCSRILTNPIFFCTECNRLGEKYGGDYTGDLFRELFFLTSTYF